MESEEVMGKEKMKMSARYIMKEDFVAESLNKFGDILSNDQENLYIERLFQQLKNPNPISYSKVGDCNYVIDFIVKLEYIFKYYNNFIEIFAFHYELFL